jgi:hypothetical protein
MKLAMPVFMFSQSCWLGSRAPAYAEAPIEVEDDAAILYSEDTGEQSRYPARHLVS